MVFFSKIHWCVVIVCLPFLMLSFYSFLILLHMRLTQLLSLLYISCFWEFLSKKYLRQISIFGTNKYKIRKLMALLLYQLLKLTTKVPLLFQIFIYSLVPNIEICLKYFMDKNSQKQPL